MGFKVVFINCRESAESVLKKIFDFFIVRYEKRNKTFSNARLARNLLEKIYVLQTSRISRQAETLSDEDFQALKVEDWPNDESLTGIY